MTVAPQHAREKGAHGGLMTTHQLAVCVMVLTQQDAGDQICISEIHGLAGSGTAGVAAVGGAAVAGVAALALHQPANDVGHADEQRDEADAADVKTDSRPRQTTEVGIAKDQRQPNCQPDEPAPQIVATSRLYL